MMRGEIWWADLGVPFGSEPGWRRPVVVVQDDAFNRSAIRTVIAAAVTTNLDLAEAPGNVFLDRSESGLPKEGVVNISRLATLDKIRLTEKVSVLPPGTTSKLDYGLRLVLNLR